MIQIAEIAGDGQWVGRIMVISILSVDVEFVGLAPRLANHRGIHFLALPAIWQHIPSCLLGVAKLIELLFIRAVAVVPKNQFGLGLQLAVGFGVAALRVAI